VRGERKQKQASKAHAASTQYFGVRKFIHQKIEFILWFYAFERKLLCVCVLGSWPTLLNFAVPINSSASTSGNAINRRNVYTSKERSISKQLSCGRGKENNDDDDDGWQ